MTKLTTSALGILLLNPMGCSGTPHEDTGTGGTVAATGGYSGVVHCDPSAAAPCGPGKICKQTMFPVMPPGGFGGGTSDISYLYECVPAGTGGSSSTGGANSTGGSTTAGGSKTLGTKAAMNGPRRGSTLEQDSWWKTAETALRRA
jgi:hypothetical protein